jgi:hypothetical protein
MMVMLRNAILILGLTLAASCAMIDEDGDATPIVRDGCHVAGCSSQLCTDRSDLVTTCEWLPEYECFQAATCERQAATGACDWTPTPALQACLAGKLSPARRTVPRR